MLNTQQTKQIVAWSKLKGWPVNEKYLSGTLICIIVR